MHPYEMKAMLFCGKKGALKSGEKKYGRIELSHIHKVI